MVADPEELINLNGKKNSKRKGSSTLLILICDKYPFLTEPTASIMGVVAYGHLVLMIESGRNREKGRDRACLPCPLSAPIMCRTPFTC